MPRNLSKAVPEGNGSIPQDAYVMLGRIKLEELRRIMSERLDKAFDKPTKMTRRENQRLSGLEQETRRPYLATEADAPTDTKTRKRMEGAAAAERVTSGDNSSAQVDIHPIRLTSFGDDFIGPPALPCSRDDALVDNGAATPKPCLSPAKMRMRTAASGLLSTGKASTATRTIYYQPRLCFCPTEETDSEKTSVQYASYCDISES